MCFTAIMPSVATLAKRNIKVWKGFDYKDSTGKFVTPYRMARYALGVMKTSTLTKKTRGRISVGLHSCITRGTARGHGSVVREAVIPKGAYYYKNNKEYVSDKLMLVLPKRKTLKKTATKKLVKKK